MIYEKMIQYVTNQAATPRHLTLVEVETAVCNFLGKQTGISRKEVAPADRVTEDLGYDRLDVLELIMAAEEAFYVTLPEKTANPAYNAAFNREPFRLSDLAELIYLQQHTRKLDLSGLRWVKLVPLFVFLALAGWILFEAFADPALIIVVVCIKCGLNDFLTAHWLWRNDPVRERGWGCFWVFCGSGFFKMALVCFVMVMGRIFAGPQTVLAIGDTWFSMYGGWLFSTLSCTWALVLAWRFKLRYWVNASIHQTRRSGTWPPFSQGGVNISFRIWFTNYCLLLTVGGVLCLDAVLGRRNDLFKYLFFVIVIGGPSLLLLTRRLLFGWAIAKCPDECWLSVSEIATLEE